MSDLIDRQAAIDVLLSIRQEEVVNGKRHHDYCSLSTAITVLKDLPSAQPEIIRCKDCKHYQFADNRAFGMPVKMCYFFGFEDVDDDDYCSRAERRIDE